MFVKTFLCGVLLLSIIIGIIISGIGLVSPGVNPTIVMAGIVVAVFSCFGLIIVVKIGMKGK